MEQRTEVPRVDNTWVGDQESLEWGAGLFSNQSDKEAATRIPAESLGGGERTTL